MQPCFIGIDIGTGSAKGAIVDQQGSVVAQASVAHQMSSPQPGWFEQDADAVWWQDVVVLAKQLMQQLDERGIDITNLKGMCVSTTAPCVLPIDRQGKPLRPGIMYGIDTRATKQIAEIETAIGADQIFEKTGQQLSSQSCCPKIRWIEQQEPEVWKHTETILTSSGYIVYRLTGRAVVDTYDAIGYAPLFNLKEKRWDSTYEDQLFSLDLLPEIMWTTEIAGTITCAAAEETGLPQGLPVLAGTADAAAEAMSSTVSDVGDMMMMYGSSNFFIMLTSALKPVSEFWASNYLIPGTSVLTGGMATVGSLFSWFNETFPGRSFTEWEKLAQSSRPGANGVTILPYFAGERTPLFDPHAKGAFYGMQLTTTAGDIYQALQEAIGFGIRHNLEVLAQAGEQAKRIVAIGGVTASDMTMQIISDCSGCIQQVPSQRLGACYGDAFLAAYATGAVSSLEDIHSWVSIEKTYTPNPKHTETYDKAYQRYRNLYESTKHLNQ